MSSSEVAAAAERLARNKLAMALPYTVSGFQPRIQVQVGDKELCEVIQDWQTLADAMLAELSTDPITPQLLEADGWRCNDGSLGTPTVPVPLDVWINGNGRLWHGPDSTEFYCRKPNMSVDVESMGEIRTLLRLSAKGAESLEHSSEMDPAIRKKTVEILERRGFYKESES